MYPRCLIPYLIINGSRYMSIDLNIFGIKASAYPCICGYAIPDVTV